MAKAKAAPVIRATTKELGQVFSVSRQQIHNWIKAGCPVAKGVRKKGGRGPIPNVFNVEEVSSWLIESGRGGGSIQRGAAAVKVNTAAAGNKPLPSRGQINTAIKNSDGDSLQAMLNRLTAAEQITHNHWKAAATWEEGDDGSQPTAGALHVLEKNWLEAVEKRRRIEKDLPEIMYKKQRFVDALEVSKLVNRAFNATASELSGLGISISEKIADQFQGVDANAVRLLIDDAVNLSKQRLVDSVGKIIG